MVDQRAKFAVIATGGKQYQVSEGDTITVERLGQESGKFTFDKVLLVDDGVTTLIGNPHLALAKVEAEIVGEVRSPKVEGVRYKAKSNRRTKYGHRQTLAKVKILAIK